MKQLLLAFLIFLPTVGLAAEAQAPTAPIPPDQVVKSTGDKLTSELRNHQDELRNNQAKLFKLVEDAIEGKFDFPYMARLVLGRAWRDATPEQRKRFTEAFRTMLIRTYSNAMLEYSDTKVEFEPLRMRPDATDATVEAVASMPSGQKVRMAYRLHLNHGQWQVYNITIDALSLVTNYRGVFAGTIRQHGLDALIKRLETKNQSILSK